ncbi:energy transducer TonB [Dyadobacter frigoris]|uniref:Energy transducer TonB n=1 Tax=Dyadobacter frigoris TaxID=2576211 RepID=A0A4U6D7R8_9BACT|nr:energy transducer TonB [Dyadobacter frigoris]TKT92806.1 energy transducer TonB [Dyadobacter frigoris]GLU54433.1 cell envelope biogenesis protein TonB [Dyadobacter frigoris]
MKRLQNNKIELLSNYLKKNGLNPELFPEILDHLACEAEERLWDGDSFEHAFSNIVETADPETLHTLSVEHNHLLAMEKTLNDIVFEGRNKSYGAYQLRKEYNSTMQRSVLLGVTFFLLVMLLPNLYARLVPEPEKNDIGFEVKLTTVDIKPDATPPPPVPVEPPKAEPQPNTRKFTSYDVLPDNMVVEEATPPTVEDLQNALPGQETVEGNSDIMDIVPPAAEVPAGKGKAVEAEVPKEETFVAVEQAPAYFGGNAAMAEFLRKNLKYPVQASRANIQGRVFVSFIVGSDGKIEDVKTLKGIGFGCDEEAERVIRLMPKWKAGRQSGTPVRVKFNLPVVFQME